jgi:quercetin dioxygenase-like cupin family protein
VNSVKPYGLEVKNAPSYWSQGILWTNLASSEQTGGSFSLMEELCSKNSGPPPHTHEQGEALYIIEGQITLIASAEKITAKAGALAYIPARCVHSFRVDTQETRILNFYFPGGFESVTTKFGVPAKSRTLPPPNLKAPGTPEQMRMLFKRVGMVLLLCRTFYAKRGRPGHTFPNGIQRYGRQWLSRIRVAAQLQGGNAEDAPTENAESDIETVEAEIVFLARAWCRASPANNTSKGSPETDSSSLVGFLFDKLKVSWGFLRSVSGSAQFS